MDEREIDIRGAVGLIRRRLKLILAVFAIVMAAAIVGLIAQTPKYTASVLLLVDTGAKELLDPAATPYDASYESARVDSEVEILKSDSVLLTVIERENIATDDEFGVNLSLQHRVLTFLRLADAKPPTGNEALQSVLLNVKKQADIHRLGLTYLISVSFTSKSPEKAARFANAIKSAYIDQQVLSLSQSVRRAEETLVARLAAASDAVVDSEGAFDAFIDANMDLIARETGRAELAEMRGQFGIMQLRRSSNAAVAENVERLLASRDWDGMSVALKDQSFEVLVRQRQEIAQQLLDAPEGDMPTNSLWQRLAGLDNELAEAAQQRMSSLKILIANQQGQALELRRQIRANVLNSDLPASILTQIFKLQQSGENARDQYQSMLARVSELSAQAQTQIAYSRSVSDASPPIKPSFPNIPLSLSIAGASALVLAVSLAFLYENVVGGFVSTEQVENVLRTKAVISVPHVVLAAKLNDREQMQSAADLLINEPLSAYAESIRRMRLLLERATRSSQVIDRQEKGAGAVILVSSAVPGEGKSTISLSLARAFGQAGKSTMLIDCDLRKPSIHKYLDVENDAGLADYLRNSDDPTLLQKIVVTDKVPLVTAIVGSKRSEVPTDQLSAGASLSKLIEISRQKSDIVILDSPPILPVIDGLYLAEHADVIAMVIGWAATSQKEARDALTALADSKPASTQLFAILNQMEGGLNVYQNKYADYYTQ